MTSIVLIEFSLGDVQMSDPVIGPDGSVYFAGVSGNDSFVVSYSSDLSTVKWKTVLSTTGQRQSSLPSFFKDGTLVVTNHYTVTALDSTNGKTVWSFEDPSLIDNLDEFAQSEPGIHLQVKTVSS